MVCYAMGDGGDGADGDGGWGMGDGRWGRLGFKLSYLMYIRVGRYIYSHSHSHSHSPQLAYL